jgi:nicotinate-nucleotide adenylyltransferase
MTGTIRQAAILGGAFDPITRGHTRIAELIISAGLGISEVWIMPCFRHAFDKRMESSVHRLAMCRTAIAKITHTKVSDYEIEKTFEGSTYFLMLKLLDEEFVKGTYALSLVIGMDNANCFEQWIEHEKLMNLVRFIVVPRVGYDQHHAAAWYTRRPHIYLDTGEPVMEVSSTLVRSLLMEKRFEEARQFIDPEVLRYIFDHRLYECT